MVAEPDTPTVVKETIAGSVWGHGQPEWANRVHIGDCLDIMRTLPADSIDLIVTSPPYADARAHTYGGISPDDYVEWFTKRAEEMFRILKPTGSFALNIKEKVVDGQRHTYVLDLILALSRDTASGGLRNIFGTRRRRRPVNGSIASGMLGSVFSISASHQT